MGLSRSHIRSVVFTFFFDSFFVPQVLFSHGLARSALLQLSRLDSHWLLPRIPLAGSSYWITWKGVILLQVTLYSNPNPLLRNLRAGGELGDARGGVSILTRSLFLHLFWTLLFVAKNH
jgi:hypothetical protein